MTRVLAAIIVVASVAGLLRVAGMADMSLHGHHAMGCETAACAAAPAPMVPAADCVAHCLQAARAAGSVPAVTAFAAVAIIALAFAVSGKRLAPSFHETGGPPSIGPSLRLAALRGVVMLN